ncbi:KpsF/GutQ family sugar-phosphate isomerase [Helicobacter sp. 23-1044]
MDFVAIAREVLEIESEAILNAKSRLNAESLSKIIDFIYHSNRLIVLGVGKSGLIGAKISATLSSTGTPSVFIHPTEAMHGDLGGICENDAILAISYSGESDEIIALMPHLRRLSKGIITMTKHKNTSISAQGDFFIDISVEKEACPLNIAPTASTTLALALGDVLAVCLMKRRNFSKENFANFHPGGSLGRRLFVKIASLMQRENLPTITAHTTLKDAIIAMTQGKLGNVLILDDGKLCAVLSDGDLRRAMMRGDFSLDALAINFANKNPKVCDDAQMLAYDALRVIEGAKIQMLVVVDGEMRVQGVVHIHKLIEAGIN